MPSGHIDASTKTFNLFNFYYHAFISICSAHFHFLLLIICNMLYKINIHVFNLSIFYCLPFQTVLNVAAGKAPMQISTEGAGIPQKAIDGSTSAFYTSDTCSLTKAERVPWWYARIFLFKLMIIFYKLEKCSYFFCVCVFVGMLTSWNPIWCNWYDWTLANHVVVSVKIQTNFHLLIR